jgi:hypothetical protein
VRFRTMLLSLLFIAGNTCGLSYSVEGVASGQQNPGPRRDDAAVTVIRSSLLKMGSLAANGRDTIATGTLTSFRDGTTVSLTMKTHGTNYIRNEVGDFVFIRSGTTGKTRFAGKDHSVAYHSIAYKRAEHLPSLLLLSEIESPDLQCVMVGQEVVNGIPASHIRLSMAPAGSSDMQAEDLISETHVWIDQQGLVIKARVFIFSPQVLQNRSPVDLYYSDYRLVDGFLVPFHISREIAHHKDSEITFNSIDVKARLSEADFQ